MPKYFELLKDPRWQRKRLEVYQKDDFRCQLCWDNTETLHVHHPVYKHWGAPWNYETFELITVCATCHTVEHLPLSKIERFMLNCLRTRHAGETVNIKLLNKILIKHYG